jgi:uncharacterized protein YidB (DUF937 family)
MGLLDDIVGRLGQQGGMLDNMLGGQNSQLADAAMRFLSNDGTVGPAGGLQDVLGALRAGGLEDVVQSWLGNGANASVSADQLQSALGSDMLSQLAARAGMDTGQAGDMLSRLLPQIVDTLSPDGQLPQGAALDGLLGRFLGSR